MSAFGRAIEIATYGRAAECRRRRTLSRRLTKRDFNRTAAKT